MLAKKRNLSIRFQLNSILGALAKKDACMIKVAFPF